MNKHIPSILLNSNRFMPMAGLGVYKATGPNEVEKAIAEAFKTGYRAIDTASVYKNEDGVGRAIKNSRLSRDEIFVTTKIWNNAQRIGDVIGAFNRSLERLQLDYVDLYLIHWPVPGCYIDTWKELIKLHAAGKARSIGVSNFDIYQLEELIFATGITPAVNQIEYHPYFHQDDVLHFCQEHGIAVQAYAPLARGAYLNNETIQTIAKRYGKTAAQTGLRWIVQKGISVIPKSTTPERIQSNCDIFDFELTESEMAEIDSLNQNKKYSSIPEDLR